ncbi:hypothetical protein [Paucibacter sp. XJ19-41]|jgi:hypothetical protein|uniref:hypothetical protein n=1 Tax=Paucibacter sp. XJ19-41 TaxID=2927824 RepID=UPI00234B9982|nr:hypothetical protein [Paucibacter sp. XJ19-41]MDC6171350.1 hypothetical protein [Paucibacter sp. XJ19-41]
MKYYLEARSIPCKQQSIEDKHQAFFSGILDLPSPWGSKSIPKLPPIGGNLSVGVGAKEFAGPGLKGSVHYSFRGLDADSAYADDFINLAFNPRKIDYQQLVEQIFIKYVQAMNAYFAEISDDEFIFQDYDERKRLKIDARHGLYRIPAVLYARDDFCRRALGLGAAEVQARLNDRVATSELIQGGVLIVLSRDVLTAPEMDALSTKAKSALAS